MHWLAYAAYPVAVAHGIGSARDLRSGGLLELTVACLLVVAAAVAYRVAATLRAVPRWRRVSAQLAGPAQRAKRLDMRIDRTQRLRVNPIRCSGHGSCAELLPELISRDEWGYPVVSAGPVPPRLAGYARRAVTDCPALALLLTGQGQR